ncbi:hypothetical protein SXCC_03013 [Gluconacetobacter sp. SXCC-1]|nr:hypothetical protein SXCC_03013 [Gluconacetobacter sp. SXCC-1]
MRHDRQGGCQQGTCKHSSRKVHNTHVLRHENTDASGREADRPDNKKMTV